MGAKTKISWTHATFNPWWGCEEVSDECDNCYARALAARWGHDVWGGKDTPRRFFGDKHWSEPVKWNREAELAGERRRVFCASMADVLERRDDLVAARARLVELIGATPWLDWLLLTKRPYNQDLLPDRWTAGRVDNVWFGATVGVVKSTARIPHVLRASWARYRFLSMEPLLERVPISRWMAADRGARIDWVITGYESGNRARPTDEDWIRETRDAVVGAGAAFHYKQKVVGRMVIDLPMLDGRRWDQYPEARA